MAGARIGPISGVNWAAYGNVASLIMQAAEASARGSAALGAGIGGGLQSLGQGIQRGRERREARAERQEARADSQARWEAEFGYRQQRDAADDTRADRALEMNSANIAADNERASVASRLAMLRTLSEGYSQAMDVANQTGDGTAYQQAQTGLQSALSAMQGLAGGLQNPQAFQQTAAFGAPAPMPAPVTDAGLGQGVGAAPARVRPAAPGAPETPSQAFERKSREMSAGLVGGIDTGTLRSVGPVELPPTVQNLVRGLYLKREAESLRDSASSVTDKSPRGQIERSARLRAALVVESQAAAPLAAAQYAKQGRGMALKEAKARQEEADRRASDAQGEKSSIEAAMAGFQAKHGRGPTPEEAELIWRQVHGGVRPDTAVENFPKPPAAKDEDQPLRLRRSVDSISRAMAEAKKKTDDDNSLESLRGGAVPAFRAPDLSGLVTDDIITVEASGPGASSPEVYAAAEAELNRRKVPAEQRAEAEFQNLPEAERTPERAREILKRRGLLRESK